MSRIRSCEFIWIFTVAFLLVPTRKNHPTIIILKKAVGLSAWQAKHGITQIFFLGDKCWTRICKDSSHHLFNTWSYCPRSGHWHDMRHVHYSSGEGGHVCGVCGCVHCRLGILVQKYLLLLYEDKLYWGSYLKRIDANWYLFLHLTWLYFVIIFVDNSLKEEGAWVGESFGIWQICAINK